MVLDPLLGIVAHPLLGQRDPRVAVDRVVAAEVQAQERRHAVPRPGRLRQIDQQVHPRSVRLVREGDRDLAADGGPAQGLPVFRAHRELRLDGMGRRRHLAVHVGFEEFHDLGPTPRVPGFRRGDAFPVTAHQGIGQRVETDLGLVIVGSRRLSHGGPVQNKKTEAHAEKRYAAPSAAARIAGDDCSQSNDRGGHAQAPRRKGASRVHHPSCRDDALS